MKKEQRMNSIHEPLLFAGSSHVSLAEEIASELGRHPGKLSLGLFPDGEIKVEILEDVRGRDVFVLQSTGIHPNFYFMELQLIIDALHRAAAKNIIAIIPYFGYSRQDRIDKSGVPITAKLIANMMAASGVTRLITIDLHSPQIEGFFEIPVTHLHCQELLAKEFQRISNEKLTVVAPDVGSIKIAKRISYILNAHLVVVEKQRISSDELKMNLIGNLDTTSVLIVDDMCSTGGTLVASADLCKRLGAKNIYCCVTHGICAANAIEKIENSHIESLILTNTLAPFNRYAESSKIKLTSIGPMLAGIIKNWAG